MKFDSNLHHRRSIRLKGYDYSQPGAYFVALVTFQRQALFGEIMDGKMILSPLGEIVRAVWFQSAEIRKEIRLSEEEFVVMPNHLHGIIWIDDGRGACHAPLPRAPQHQNFRREGRTLGSMVAGFKGGVTSRAKRELHMSVIWQRNYYDHIIRNEVEWGKTWDYIQTNPMRWEEDKLFTVRPNTD